MKYGAHVYVWQERYGDEELAALLGRAVALGLDFVEVSVGDDLHFDAVLLGRRASALGLELGVSPGGLWPMQCDVSSDDAGERAMGVAWHRRALDVCGECGAVAYAGGLYGHPGRVGPRPLSRKQKLRLAECLHDLAEYAAGRGTRMALEPMSHFRTHVANTPAQVIELIELADHEGLSCLFDTFHAVTEVESFAGAIADAMPRLWGLHACASHRGVPGTGILPWDEIIGALKAHGWDGYVAFESYNSTDRGGEFAFSRGLLHNVCPDGDAFVRAARAFIEAKFAQA